GRLATEAATLLRGKHKVTWAPHMDGGDHVIVINASAISVNPRKLADKRYYRHFGYPGGINPERVVRLAVKGMLPKGPLGRQMLKRLRVYPGAQHPHIAQNPQPRALTSA